MAKKRKWSDWAVSYISDTGRCPGDLPAMGSPDDLMTEQEFLMSIQSGGTHEFKGCHFAEELGMKPVAKTMKEVTIDNEDSLIKRAERLKDDVVEVRQSKDLVKLKRDLHLYVDRIKFKESGALSVPEPLLDIRKYIENILGN